MLICPYTPGWLMPMDRPVYFVREDWVRTRYAHEHPGWDRRGPPALHAERRPEERRDHERHD